MDRVSPQVADVLDRAADLLSEPGAWTQGAFARNEKGKNTGLSGFRGSAVCWCILGATAQVTDDDDAGQSADDYIREVVGYDIGGWNDAPGRTQAEVVAKLRAAASLAREPGEGSE